MIIEVVGILNGESGRSCEYHDVCGKSLTTGTPLVIQRVVVKEQEPALGVFRDDEWAAWLDFYEEPRLFKKIRQSNGICNRSIAKPLRALFLRISRKIPTELRNRVYQVMQAYGLTLLNQHSSPGMAFIGRHNHTWFR